MRFAELRHGGERPFVLDLHPRLTLLTGLGDDGRRWMAELVQRALRGDLGDVGGTVEVHGVERQLSDALIAELGLPANLDVLVRPADLPGARTVVPATGGDRPSGDVDVDDPALPDLRAIANELSQARHALARAAENRAHTEHLLTGSRHALAPEAADVVDAEARLADARRRREEAAAAVGAIVRAAPDDDRRRAAADRARRQEQRAHLETRRQSVMESLDRLTGAGADADPSAVAGALARRRAWVPTEPQPVPAALALAEQLDTVAAELAALPEPMTPPPSLLAGAERELAAAREAVAVADGALAAREVPPDDVARIDAAHTDVVDAEDRAERRLASPVAKRRVRVAEAAERAVLAELGFSSYSDYLLSTSTLIADPDAPKRAADARRRLADAEAVWDELTGQSVRVRREDAEDRQVELLKQARELLGALPPGGGGDDGGGVDVAGALRALRVGDGGPDERELRDALVASGVPADGVAGDALLDVADRFLADAAEHHARRAALQAELSGVVDDLDSVNVELSLLPPVPAAGGDVDIALDDARAALQRARDDEQRAHRAAVDARSTAAEHRAAVQRIEALEADLAGARAAEQQATVHVAHLEAVTAEAEARHEERRRARQAAAERLDGVLDLTGVERLPTEVYLLARVAAHREVGEAGSLPLVLVDATSGLPVDTTQGVLDVVERFSAVVQFVLMSDDPDIEAWARSFGPDGAAVRRFSFVAAAAE